MKIIGASRHYPNTMLDAIIDMNAIEQRIADIRGNAEWQRGLEDYEIDACVRLASEMIRGASRRGYDIDRKVDLVRAMLAARPERKTK